MYTREEEKQIRLDFWKGFDVYSDLHQELQWRDPKWVLYKTHLKHVELKFDVNHNHVIVALEINHRNEERQLNVFEALEKYKILLEDQLEDVIWDFAYALDSGKNVGRVYVEKKQLNYKRESDRKAIYDFMASQMIILERNFMDIRDSLKQDLLNID